MASKTAPATTAKNTTGVAKESQPDEDDVLHLLVGGYNYTTHRDVLLSSEFHSGDDQNYFQALLSGRWKRTKTSDPIEIPDIDGRLFFYVLYFLQVGELPRSADGNAYCSLLSKKDINELESQADFFGLTRLVELCKKTKDILKGVRGTGDLDLTPFSDFSFSSERNSTKHADNFEFRIEYTYQGTTGVYCVGRTDYNWPASFIVKKYPTGIYKYTEIVDENSVEPILKRISEVIEDAYTKRSSKDVEISVTHVLNEIDIAPEANLCFAFIVNDMIDSYERGKYDNFNFTASDLFCDDIIFSFTNMEDMYLKNK